MYKVLVNILKPVSYIPWYCLKLLYRLDIAITHGERDVHNINCIILFFNLWKRVDNPMKRKLFWRYPCFAFYSCKVSRKLNRFLSVMRPLSLPPSLFIFQANCYKKSRSPKHIFKISTFAPTTDLPHYFHFTIEQNKLLERKVQGLVGL